MPSQKSALWTLLLAVHFHNLRACQESGYCSLGAVKPFYGSIYSGAALREALEARSFRQEVILMVSDPQRIDSFRQVASSMQALGFGHILLLALTEADCNLINQAVPDVGCGWTTFTTPPDMSTIFALWSLRYRFLVRAARLGYNVLLLDSDVTLYDDPYKYFKQPPFRDLVVINQQEYTNTANGGVIYIQNAAPGGPAVFMFAEAVTRPLRWADDGWATANKLKIGEICLYMDQDGYADVLPDMVSGYMLFPKAWDCIDEKTRAEAKWQEVREKFDHYAQWPTFTPEKQHPVPKEWQLLTGGPTTTFRTLDLKMPNCRGWPEEFGGQWYSDRRGNFSTEFLQQLHDDCPRCPMWPDPEVASNAAAADKVPTEKFALMPYWLGIGYWLRGRHGYLNPNLTGNMAQQVIAHTHWIRVGDTSINKKMIPLSTGQYNWTVAEQAKGGDLYIACGPSNGPDCSKLQVLAFSPAVEQLLGETGSWQEFALLLRGLAQLGRMLGRAVAWPSLPCSTPWIQMTRQITAAPIDLGDMWLPWSNADGQLMCTPFEYANEYCLQDGLGLLPWEWQHFQQQHSREPDPGQDRPDQHELHAVHAEHDPDELGRHAGFNLSRHVVSINSEDVLEDVAELQQEPVILLKNLVHIDFANEQHSDAFDRLQQDCTVLNTTKILSKFATWQWNLAGGSLEGTTIVQEAVHAHVHVAARLRRGKLHRRAAPHSQAT